MSSTPNPPLDFEIPGYDILESIGRGGMASVYRARQHTFDRNVALKILKPDLSEDDAFCQRFIMESMIVAKLNHSHIVQVYDVGEISNHYYIAMEFLSGGDLSARLKQGMSAKEAIHVIKQIASALDFAHRKNIIHRDLKPDNVMFREDEAAVLTDFGIAKETTADINLTQTGLIVGTPKYMSPEQIRGSEPTPQGDIYSLGIMFFQLLCNRVPFQGPDLVTTAYKHFNDPVPQLPSHLAPFQSLLEQMLAKDADDRIARGNDVVKAIEDIEKRFPSFEPNKDDETLIMQLEDSGEDATVVKVNSGTNQEPETVDKDKSNQKTTIVSATPDNKVPLASSAETIVADTSDKTQLKPRTNDNQQKAEVASEKNEANESSTENNSEEKPDNKNLKIIGGSAAALVLAAVLSVSFMPSGSNNSDDPNTEQTSGSDLTEQQDVHSKKIDDLLTAAAIAFKKDPIATHKKSAMSLYKEVLALSPDDPRAVKALHEIASLHMQAATKALQKLDFNSAKQHIDFAKQADTSINTATIQKEIDNSGSTTVSLSAKQRLQISALLEQAKYYEKQGALTSPKGENAAEAYQKVLAIDPGNTQASARLEEISGK